MSTCAWGDDQSTDQPQGLRRAVPSTWALIDATIIPEPGRIIEHGIVLIREGRLHGVGADVPIPPDARIVSLPGKILYPGLIDAYSEQAVITTGIEAGFPYWNTNIRPQLNIAGQLAPVPADNAQYRKQGVAARLAAPQGGIFKGSGALVLTADRPKEESVVRESVSQHIRLTIGRTRSGYPNSPMGAVALARQALYDAQWYRAARQAVDGDSTLPHPDHNDALAALQAAVDRGTPFIAETSNELFFLRADDFAREFGLNLIVLGSGNEYRRLDAIRATGRAVIVPVNFPKPPNVGTVESALNVSLESLMHWDHAPENPSRLEQAGVRFALTSFGMSDKSKFLEQVRTAVVRGLTPDTALAALTTVPAELFDVAEDLGQLSAGRLANIVVTDGPLFDAKTKIVETWIAGERFEHAPAPDRDVAGKWNLGVSRADSTQAFVLTLRRSGNKLSGSLKPTEGKVTPLKSVTLNDARLSGTFAGKLLEVEGVVRFTLVISADNQLGQGHLLMPDETRIALSVNRLGDAEPESDTKPTEPAEKPPDDAPDPQNPPDATESPDDTAKPDQDADQKAPPEMSEPVRSSFPVNYPLGAFGVDQAPEQPLQLAATGVTIWTCGDAGIIENGTVLIGEGKILEVGRDVKVPPQAAVIDGTGLHLTPGIIDCHSHMGTDGGINESAQAVSAEVRIGDFINCDDIDIYRQLAGGVTAINVLHGSANPIGGQNQVLKLRWGATPADMKFREAPPGIKFALGENVKQSNSSTPSDRYPQTRMGVEQLFIDEFRAAREYQQRWTAWKLQRQGIPPRRDLELDTIVEILNKERWIHCHSYRQDEILALIRVADDFGIQIGTLQHILEGYKVADEMARHGIMGSAFSDWWNYKFEVIDAIPYAGALMHNAGVVVSFNSDDRELARHLNHEAGKAVKYGGVEPAEALKFVTLNPARQLRIDSYVGSIEPGKHADFVLWTGSPLSPASRCEQTWIDGRKYFDRLEDAQRREQQTRWRAMLIQKILESRETMEKPGESPRDESLLWPNYDEFCIRSR